MKKIIQNMALAICSLICILICAEFLLHFLPVSSGVGFLRVDQTQPTFRAQPNRDIIYSKGWNFKLFIKKHVNNAGFLNAHDYIKDDPRPLLAVVGDSYVEALQLEDSAPYYELLNNAQNKIRVYSFGFSGAPLSQYLIWAQHAKQNYNNDYLIINVVGNDYDESLKQYKFAPGFYHYAYDNTNTLQLERCDLKHNAIRNIAKKSKLIGYLMRNLMIEDAKNKFVRLLKGNKVSYGVVDSNDSNELYLSNSYNAVNAFFKDLPNYAGLPANKIAFVIDDRVTTYNKDQNPQELAQSYFYKMKTYFIERAQQLGYTVFDMQQPFDTHFKQNDQHFEFDFDYHWNALGHQVVAETIEKSAWWNSILND